MQYTTHLFKKPCCQNSSATPPSFIFSNLHTVYYSGFFHRSFNFMSRRKSSSILWLLSKNNNRFFNYTSKQHCMRDLVANLLERILQIGESWLLCTKYYPSLKVWKGGTQREIDLVLHPKKWLTLAGIGNTSSHILGGRKSRQNLKFLMMKLLFLSSPLRRISISQ